MTQNRTAGDAANIGGQIDALLGDVTEPRARERMEDLVRLLMEFYGAGLERVVELAGPDLVGKLADDALVGSLLILHDLHPLDTAARVQKALDKVRPYLGSHAGGVTQLGIDDDMVLHLRLEGTCDGCPASMVTVKSAIEGAITEAAPEIMSVDVEGVAEPHSGPAVEPGFIPLDAVQVCPAPATGAAT